MSQDMGQQEQRGARWQLIRDVLVLQGKLLVDGLRDLLLVPASLIAGMVSLVSSADGQPGSQFYQLLALGKQSERWINLFGALKNAPQQFDDTARSSAPDVDDLVAKFESFVVDEYKRGGLTAQAKARMDRIIDAVGRRPGSKA